MQGRRPFCGSFYCLAAALLCGSVADLRAAATIVIQNGDPANVGFNDVTPVAPVGGNPGTTLGDQRLNVYNAVATYWGAQLNSNVPINVLARWTALSCTAASAVLGSAGPTNVFRFTGSPFITNHWYHVSLADKLANVELLSPAGGPHISANFNVNLGQPNCLAGSPFYLGLDGNHGPLVDFYTVLLHELGHGLGFSTVTNGNTGAQLAGFPAVWDGFLLDTTTNKHWDVMTNAERQTSALNSRKLVWDGPNVTFAVPQVLNQGFPLMTVSAPALLAATYQIGTAAFGPPLTSPGVTGEVMPVQDNTGGGNACTATALPDRDAAAINGKIALIDRGGCVFTVKVKNAQDAGAIGVLIVDNAPGSPPVGLAGSDPAITIPAIRISQVDGSALEAFLQFRSRNHSGLLVTIGVDLAVRAGADASNRALLYTPNPYQPGSSISHYDTSAFPNQLMEPAINGDLLHTVLVPNDLTLKLLNDIGWN